MAKDVLLISVLLININFGQFYVSTLPNISYRRISPNGLEFLKKREGCVLEAYQDYKGVWTIGYGQTNADLEIFKYIINGEIKKGLIITQEQADRILEEVLRVKYVPIVNYFHLYYDFNQNQFDAMVSFQYNVKGGLFALTKNLTRNINEISDKILEYNDGGKLNSRRRLEYELFNKKMTSYIYTVEFLNIDPDYSTYFNFSFDGNECFGFFDLNTMNEYCINDAFYFQGSNGFKLKASFDFMNVGIETSTNQYQLYIGFYGPIKEGIYHLTLEKDIITDPPRFTENSERAGILMKYFSINDPIFRIETYNKDLSDLAYYLYDDDFKNIRILAGNMLVIDSLFTFYNKKLNKNFNIKGYFYKVNINRIQEEIKNYIILNCQIIENTNEIIRNSENGLYFYYDSRIQCHSTLNEIYEAITLYIPIFDIYYYKNKVEEYKDIYDSELNYNTIDNTGLKVKNIYQSPKSIIRIDKIEINNEIKNYINDVPNYLVKKNILNITLYGEIIKGNGFNQSRIDNNMEIYNGEIYDLNININGKNIEINGMMIYSSILFQGDEHIFILKESFLATSIANKEKDYQLIEPFNIKKIFYAEQTEQTEQINNNKVIVLKKFLYILLGLFIFL